MSSFRTAPEHPNRAPFSGVLTYVDETSDRAPSGARGRRVRLTQKATEDALATLIGMAVDFCPGWGGHDPRRKCGIITGAVITLNRLEVRGYIFALDFPDVLRYVESHRDDMGMSYQLHNAHVKDMRSSVWEIEKLTFTGAAILLRDKAAYGKTSFTIDEMVVPAIAANSEKAV